MTRNYTIDLFRLIASFFIVCIHTTLPSFGYEVGSTIRLSGRWAVPFFFIVTGYYLGKKIKSRNKLDFSAIEKHVIKLISIFIVSFAIYLIPGIKAGLFTNNIALLFVGPYWHLWFIGSMIFGYILIWYIYTINYEKILPVISVLILIIAVVSDSYDIMFFNKKISFDKIPVFLISIPFMYIGIYVSNKKLNKKALSVWTTLFLVGFLMQFFEIYLLFKKYDIQAYHLRFLISTIATTIALFYICLTLNIKDNYLSSLGRKYSLFIYIYHMLGYIFIHKVFTIFDLLDAEYLQLLSPVICFSLSLSIAIFLDRFFPRLFLLLNGDFKLTVGNRTS